MYARTVDEAAEQLCELRREEWEDAAMAALALGLALAATQIRPTLGPPLLLGGLALAGCWARAIWRRWDLLDRLVLDRDAYAIPEVRGRAARATTTNRRHELADSIWTILELPELEPRERIDAVAPELAGLAFELDDPKLGLDAASAVACERMLTDGIASPLLNRALPPEDLRSCIRRIRAGFEPLRPDGSARVAAR